MEGFQQLWEHLQSMDRTSDKVAYGAGVATGTAGIAFGAEFAFHWVIDRYDEFETRAIERIMRKVNMQRTPGNNLVSEQMLSESKSDGVHDMRT